MTLLSNDIKVRVVNESRLAVYPIYIVSDKISMDKILFSLSYHIWI
jgi:hypothetical protein